MKIGVELPGRFEDAGDYLADARALDAAGVDSLWLDGLDCEPWLLMGGIAAVTGRARLVVPASADLQSREARADSLPLRIATLDRLSRGRLVVRIELSKSSADGAASALLDAVCAAGGRRVLLGTPSLEAARLLPAASGSPAVVGCALGVAMDPEIAPAPLPPEACRAAFEDIVRLRTEAQIDGPVDFWMRCPVPEDRASWRRALADAEAAGATAVLVPANPRLLDILRNPDDEDDRSDLTLAQG